jgi:hypothetical protein
MPRSSSRSCGRCGAAAYVTLIGSFFDTAIICDRCERIERAHPAFAHAHAVEADEVRRGNLNFAGVGLPDGLAEACHAARAAAEAAGAPSEYDPS